MNVAVEEAPEDHAGLGLILFLLALGVGFATLFVFYGVMRASMPAWPPPGLPRVPLLFPTLNTGVTILASVTYHYATRQLAGGHPRAFARALTVTTFLGGIFLVLQLLLAIQTWALGVRAEGSAYGALMYTLAGFHALHVAVGVVSLAVVAGQALAQNFGAANLRRIRFWGWYWHFVGAIWILMYLLVFVI